MKTITIAGLITIAGTSMLLAAGNFSEQISIQNAYWNDGGSLSGYFNVEFNSSGVPLNIISADLITGNSVAGYYGAGSFNGYEYIYNVAGKSNTSTLGNFYDNTTGTYGAFDIVENGTHPANECLINNPNNGGKLFIDFVGTQPTTIYAGGSTGQYSSENYTGAPVYRDMKSGYANTGTLTVTAIANPVPEPRTGALAGIGGLGMLIWATKRTKRSV